MRVCVLVSKYGPCPSLRPTCLVAFVDPCVPGPQTIATFRAPATQFVMALMRRLNPTASLLKSDAFCVRHEYVFSLLCLLNVNMGALDLSRTKAQEHRYRTAN